jgi:23S rRNA-/tRNA-specific pseudouridylate synthase/SAM-dependent methyltransferase
MKGKSSKGAGGGPRGVRPSKGGPHGRPKAGPRPQSQEPHDWSAGGGPASSNSQSSREVFIARDLRIVHEDQDIVVLDKPAGLLTAVTDRTGASTAPNVFDFVKAHVRRRNRTARVWIIHRLDKEASGLLVFAKSERAFISLKDQFRSKDASRIYFAVVEGIVGEARGTKAGPKTPKENRPAIEGTLRSYLTENEHGLVHSVQMSEAEGAKLSSSHAPRSHDDHEPRLAITHYRVVEAGKGRTLVQCRLETGRKNQIRVQMRDMGHPLSGDQRYLPLSPDGRAPHFDRDRAIDQEMRLCLHATELSFEHPGTRESVRFQSPTPHLFYRLVGMKTPEDRTGEAMPAAKAAEPAPKKQTDPAGPAAESAWDHVAGWYTDLIERRTSDHHEDLILPGATRLLGTHAGAGKRVLDIACGEGVLARQLAAEGADVLGVDAAPGLIEAARRAAVGSGPGRAAFVVEDARKIGTLLRGDLTPGSFDSAACIMALMNIDPLDGMMKGVASALKPGGVFVAVLLHPAFRSPGRTSWGWDTEPGAEENRAMGQATRARSGRASGPPPASVRAVQYRRVDAYLSADSREIVMNPGAVSSGKPPVTTMTYHRPISMYVEAMAAAGLLIDRLEEWASKRESQPGPRAAEENRARREFPAFLALRAVKPRA